MHRRPLNPIAIRIAELERLIAGERKARERLEVQLAYWKAKP